MRISRLLSAALPVLLAAGLVSCSTATPPDAPAPSASAPQLSKAAVTERCVSAVSFRAPDAEGSVPFEPVPAECAALSDSEYLDAYARGLREANQRGRDDLQREIDAAASADAG